MIPDNLTPAQADALERLFDESDLIGRTPMACEIEWALQRAEGSANAAIP